MTAPSIIEVHPANGAEGVVLSDQIYVVFDREVDHTTVQIMLETRDTDRWSGPEQVRWDNPDTDADDDVLATPGYKGMVDGVLSYEKVDEDGNDVSGFDYTGGGVNWRAKVTFTPDEPLAPNLQYRVWIIGDEETGDDIISGVAGRTVFDPVKGANLGDGDAVFSGGYTGTISNAYTVRVKEAGDASDKLLFQYWLDSAPLVIRELNTSQRSQLLGEGIYVRFDGDFEIDDEFTVQVRISDRMQSTYTWVFTTGAGSIITIPDSVTQTPSVPVGGFDSGTSSTTTAGFSVLALTPESRQSNIDPLTILEATVLFSDDIDEDTITDDTVTVWSEPVNGDSVQFEADGAITKTLSVSGATLTITFTGAGDVDTSQLHNNNMAFIELDETISSTTEGDTLGDNFTWYFTTTYTPLYSAIRRIRLDLGALIADVPDDTINLAIFEASLEAQALTFGTPASRTASMTRFFTFARRQYVTCVTELIILNAISGGSGATGNGGKSKRLADLSISYTDNKNVDDLLSRAIACRLKWEATLTSAGEISPGTSQRPSMVIKGIMDVDRPEIGRDWQPTSTYAGLEEEYPAANTKTRHSVLSRRWKRSFAINRWGSRFGRYSS